MQPTTVVELARRHDLVHTLPTTDPDRLADWFVFRNFADFIPVIRAIQNLIRTPDDFALITYQAGAEMAEQNIRYRELTVSPYNHTHIYDKGFSIGELLVGLAEGRRNARSVRIRGRLLFSGSPATPSHLPSAKPNSARPSSLNSTSGRAPGSNHGLRVLTRANLHPRRQRPCSLPNRERNLR